MASKKDLIKTAFGQFLRTLSFINIPISKKFYFFSAGSLFWLIATSAIGFIMIFNIGAHTSRLVDVITPQQKALNSCVRKLRGANVSMHKIVIADVHDDVLENFHRGKSRIDDCRADLQTLLDGGLIKDYSRSADELYDEFYVPKVTDEVRRRAIVQALDVIPEMEGMMTDLGDQKEKNLAVTTEIRSQLARYDNATQNNVAELNKLSVNLSAEWGTVSDLIRTKFHVGLLLIGITFVVGATLSIVFGFLISQNIVRPLNRIIEKFKHFTTKGNELDSKLPVISKDEIGELTKQYNRFLDTLKIITSFKSVIEEDEEVDDIYVRIGQIITTELGFENCNIYEISTFTHIIKAVYPRGAEATDLHCSPELLGSSDLCRVKRTGRTVSSVEYPGICKYFSGDTGNVHYCLPIIINGKVGGVVQIMTPREESESLDIKQRLSRAKEYIAEAQPVLSVKRILRAFKETSIRDGLTNIYNRRFLDEMAENLSSGLLRRETKAALLMCDLDHFKEVNDAYGHDVGDIVLKETARVIKNCVRNSDLVIRFGGEEFLVLLMDIEPDHALSIAEKIRVTLEQKKFNINGGFLQKTLSIGVSIFPLDGQTIWESIKFADIALYRAKSRGRNCVVRFMTDMSTDKE